MNPRPFYRSRLFWLGLPGLVFLLWVLVPGRASEVTWVRASDSFSISREDGSIRGTYQRFMIRRGHPTLDFLLPPTGFSSRSHADSVGTIFAPAFEMVGGRGATHFDSVSMGCWFMLILYLAAWLGFLLWWQRRKSRLMKLQTPP